MRVLRFPRMFSFLIITFFTAVLFFSCSTESDLPSFTSDSNLRLKSIITYTSVNPDQKFTRSFNYDNTNKLVKIESNSLGSTAEYRYDNQGRLTQIGDDHYFYNSSNDIYKIKNENLLTAAGTYDSTMVYYHQGKIASIVESYTNNTSKTTYTTDISYNNKDQARLSLKTERKLIFESGNEYITQKDKETYSYDVTGNIEHIISENDYDSSDFLEIHRSYLFDNYKNPITLILKATGLKENSMVLYLTGIAYNHSFHTGRITNYFINNNLHYESIPQTSDDNFVQYRFTTNYTYNEYGYPTSGEEVVRLLNRDVEYINYITYEYEEY